MFVRLMLAAAFAIGLASAQPGGGGMGGDMGSGMGGMARRQSPLEMFVDKLKLKDDQKDEVQKILSATAEKIAPVREQLTKGRSVIFQALMSKASDDDIKKLMGDYTLLSAQVTGLEADAFGKILALLKPNQQKNAPQAFDLLATVFQGSGGGGGGRGRGGMRQGGGGGRQ